MASGLCHVRLLHAVHPWLPASQGAPLRAPTSHCAALRSALRPVPRMFCIREARDSARIAESVVSPGQPTSLRIRCSGGAAAAARRTSPLRKSGELGTGSRQSGRGSVCHTQPPVQPLRRAARRSTGSKLNSRARLDTTSGTQSTRSRSPASGIPRDTAAARATPPSRACGRTRPEGLRSSKLAW